jgi:prepilin-type N-terminal cleavage/methylation domain-containing protein
MLPKMTALARTKEILSSTQPRRRSVVAGFTLIELLVASAVLALLLGLLLQVANHTLQASRVTTQQLDATQSARRVLDSLSSDLANSVNTGSAVLYKPSGGSLSLAFLTASRGPSTMATPSRFLAVNYKLESHKIIRSYLGIDWSTKELLQAAESAADSGTPSVLSPAILQFAVLALLEDGETIVRLQDGSVTPPLAEPPVWRKADADLFQGQTVPTTWSALVPATPPPTPKTPRVQALLVAIAAIDEQNLEILTSTQRDIFKAPTTSDPVKEWEDTLASADFRAPARAAVRFYSKVIPLP